MKLVVLNRRWKSWRRRNTGTVVAVPTVAIGLLALALIEAPTPAPVIPPRIIVEFSPVEPEPDLTPVIQEPIAQEELLPPEDVVATRVNAQEQGDDIVDPIEAFNEAMGMTDSAPSSLQDWVPTISEAAQLAALRESLAAQDRFLEQRRTELQKEIVRGEVVSAATDFMLNSDGGLTGAIRTLDIQGFPLETVIPLLQRYGISYERRFTRPVAGRTFLNAAQTSEGTFVRNLTEEGYYNVMTISPMATNFLARLEIQALQERNYDPRTTRIRKIVFGVVKNREDEFDLGVVDLQVERIR